MKVTKTNEEEITKFSDLLNEISWLSKDLRERYDFSNMNWIQ